MSEKLETLKAEAIELGIDFHHNTGELKLEELIKAKKLELEATMNPPKEKKPEDEPKVKLKTEVKEETQTQRLSRLRREQTALIRVVIHCNNDQKKEWQGENFTVANRAIGSITKFIPFDIDEGYHIPKAMYNTLEEKMCQKFRNVKKANGETVKEPFMTKEYSITVLPPLTQKELDKLAAAQKSRGSIE